MSELQNVVLDSKPVKKVSSEILALVDKLKERFPNGFEHDNLMEATMFAMRHLAVHNKRDSGNKKKKMIVDALIMLLDNTDSGELEKFEPILKSMLPTIIDNLIDVEKGKLHINKKLPKACLMCC